LIAHSADCLSNIGGDWGMADNLSVMNTSQPTNYLAGKQGDAVNALLAAVGYNFSLLLNWLRQLLCLLFAMISTALPNCQSSRASNPSRRTASPSIVSTLRFQNRVLHDQPSK